MKKRVLIIGCGDIGSSLGLRLCADGGQVWGLRRNIRAIPPPILPLCADVMEPGSLVEIPDRLDAVVCTLTPGKYTDEAYASTYVRGMTNALRALRHSGNESARVVFVSSTSVYGQDAGEWVDETSVTEPRDFAGRRMLEAEAVVHGHGSAAVSVRAGGIYGPGRVRMLDRLMSGGMQWPSQQPLYRNLIHRDDLVAALVHILYLPVSANLYLAVDEEPADTHQYLLWLISALGAPPAGSAAATADGRRRRANKRCSSARLRATGFCLQYPTYREGYSSVIAAYLQVRQRP